MFNGCHYPDPAVSGFRSLGNRTNGAVLLFKGKVWHYGIGALFFRSLVFNFETRNDRVEENNGGCKR